MIPGQSREEFVYVLLVYYFYLAPKKQGKPAKTPNILYPSELQNTP